MSKLSMYLLGAFFVAGGLTMTLYKLGILNIWSIIGVAIIVGFGIRLAWVQPRQKENPEVHK